jgi:hypothetical protein
MTHNLVNVNSFLQESAADAFRNDDSLREFVNHFKYLRA